MNHKMLWYGVNTGVGLHITTPGFWCLDLTSPLVKDLVASRALESPLTPPHTLSVALPNEMSERCVHIPAVIFCPWYCLLISLDGRRSRVLTVGVRTL